MMFAASGHDPDGDSGRGHVARTPQQAAKGGRHVKPLIPLFFLSLFTTAQAQTIKFVTEEYLSELEAEMMAAAETMEFERAAAIRDRILQLKRSVGEKLSEVEVRSYQPTGAKRRRGKGRAQVPRPKKRM